MSLPTFKSIVNYDEQQGELEIQPSPRDRIELTLDSRIRGLPHAVQIVVHISISSDKSITELAY